MSSTRIVCIEKRTGYSLQQSVKDYFEYAMNKRKTADRKYVTAVNCTKETAVLEIYMRMLEYKNYTGNALENSDNDKRKNKMYGEIRQSFLPGEVDAETAHEIAIRLAKEVLDDDMQYVVCTHIDKKHIHTHIRFSMFKSDLSKFREERGNWKKVKSISDRLCKEYKLSVIVPSNEKRSNVYSKCADVSFRAVLKDDIDKFINQAKTYDEFLDLMRQDYFVDTSGKYISFRHKTNGQQRPIRSYSITKDGAYSEEMLRLKVKTGYVPQSKVALNFEQKLQAKAKCRLFNNRPVTNFQKLRYVQTMFNTLKVLNQNNVSCYSDIQKSIDTLNDTIENVHATLVEANKKILHFNSLITSIDIFNQHKEINLQYSQSILKSKFYATHKNELDLFNMASDKLSDAGINPNTANKEKLLEGLNSSQAQLDEIKERFSIVKGQFRQISKAKSVVDGLYQKDVSPDIEMSQVNQIEK